MIAATIQFFDLFSGIGGFREGLRRAGNFEMCIRDRVNDSTTLNFEPAGQGKKRTDHVFIKYTNDSGVEKVEFENH